MGSWFGLVDENTCVIKRGKGREEGVLRMAARRATASGGGTKPGAEPEKTSRLVSKSRCIGFGDGEAATSAAADFLLRRRVFRDEARPSTMVYIGAMMHVMSDDWPRSRG
jgi:hypothetical protein